MQAQIESDIREKTAHLQQLIQTSTKLDCSIEQMSLTSLVLGYYGDVPLSSDLITRIFLFMLGSSTGAEKQKLWKQKDVQEISEVDLTTVYFGVRLKFSNSTTCRIASDREACKQWLIQLSNAVSTAVERRISECIYSWFPRLTSMRLPRSKTLFYQHFSHAEYSYIQTGLIEKIMAAFVQYNVKSVFSSPHVIPVVKLQVSQFVPCRYNCYINIWDRAIVVDHIPDCSNGYYSTHTISVEVTEEKEIPKNKPKESLVCQGCVIS